MHLLQHGPGLEIREGCAPSQLRSGWSGSCQLNNGGLAQVMAFEESQKYKEGKYILEKARIMKVRPGEVLVFPFG